MICSSLWWWWWYLKKRWIPEVENVGAVCHQSTVLAPLDQRLGYAWQIHTSWSSSLVWSWFIMKEVVTLGVGNVTCYWFQWILEEIHFLQKDMFLKLLIQINPNQNEGGANYTPAHQVITIINDDSLEIMILITNQQGDQRPMTFPSKCVGSQISAEPLLWDQPDQLLSQSNTKERAKKSQSKERTVKNSQRKEKIFFGR